MTGQIQEKQGDGSTVDRSARAKRAKAIEILANSAESAAQTLADMVAGKTPAKREHLDAVKTLLDRVGIVPPERSPDLNPLDLAALSTEELRALLSGVEAQLASQAKPINATRLGASTSQVADMFD